MSLKSGDGGNIKFFEGPSDAEGFKRDKGNFFKRILCLWEEGRYKVFLSLLPYRPFRKFCPLCFFITDKYFFEHIRHPERRMVSIKGLRHFQLEVWRKQAIGIRFM